MGICRGGLSERCEAGYRGGTATHQASLLGCSAGGFFRPLSLPSYWGGDTRLRQALSTLGICRVSPHQTPSLCPRIFLFFFPLSQVFPSAPTAVPGFTHSHFPVLGHCLGAAALSSSCLGSTPVSRPLCSVLLSWSLLSRPRWPSCACVAVLSHAAPVPSHTQGTSPATLRTSLARALRPWPHSRLGGCWEKLCPRREAEQGGLCEMGKTGPGSLAWGPTQQ